MRASSVKDGYRVLVFCMTRRLRSSIATMGRRASSTVLRGMWEEDFRNWTLGALLMKYRAAPSSSCLPHEELVKDEPASSSLFRKGES